MKALVYSAPDIPKLVEVDEPVLCDDEVLVKVHAAGICGTDIAIISGNHPRAKTGLVLGHEFAGEVVEINAVSKTDIAIGDKVTVFPLLVCGNCWACRNDCEHVCKTLRMTGIDKDGGLAEYVKIPLNITFKLPQSMNYQAAALVEPIAVGIHAVNMGQVQPGDNVMVMGAGPIGLIVAMCLKRIGVENIVITDIDPYRLNLAKEFGFDALNCTECNITEEIENRTNGQGADVIFECAGSKSAAMDMCQLARSRGKIVMVSVHKVHHEVDLRAINFKEISVIGSGVYARDDYQKAIEMIDDTSISKLISHRVKLDDAVKGIELMKSGKEVCKIIVTME